MGFGANIARFGRSVMFQVAEVMVPRSLLPRFLRGSLGSEGPPRPMTGDMSMINRSSAGEPRPFSAPGAGVETNNAGNSPDGDSGPVHAKAVDRGTAKVKSLT